ncbi:hypothetical protein HDU76_005881 [Blyttiomyces sp. JEL0837]|nr:hypothetical protein HDU76_005881 [Blyttiomyces sp. JEL0837]
MMDSSSSSSTLSPKSTRINSPHLFKQHHHSHSHHIRHSSNQIDNHRSNAAPMDFEPQFILPPTSPFFIASNMNKDNNKDNKDGGGDVLMTDADRSNLNKNGLGHVAKAAEGGNKGSGILSLTAFGGGRKEKNPSSSSSNWGLFGNRNNGHATSIDDNDKDPFFSSSLSLSSSPPLNTTKDTTKSQSQSPSSTSSLVSAALGKIPFTSTTTRQKQLDAVKKNHKKQSAGGLTGMWDSEEDNMNHEANARKRKKFTYPPDDSPSKPSPDPYYFFHPSKHLVWTQVLMGYLRLGFTIFTMGLSVYLIVQFIWTVHHDLEMKAIEYSQEIAQQVADCSKSYLENRCSPVSARLPAMQSLCTEWELCMTRDPREVGRLKVGAETVAEILNKLFEPLTYKTMVFVSVLFFGTFFLWLTAPRLGGSGSSSTAVAKQPLLHHATTLMNPGGLIKPSGVGNGGVVGGDQHHHYYSVVAPPFAVGGGGGRGGGGSERFGVGALERWGSGDGLMGMGFGGGGGGGKTGGLMRRKTGGRRVRFNLRRGGDDDENDDDEDEDEEDEELEEVDGKVGGRRRAMNKMDGTGQELDERDRYMVEPNDYPDLSPFTNNTMNYNKESRFNKIGGPPHPPRPLLQHRQLSFTSQEVVHDPIYRNGYPTQYLDTILNSIRLKGTIIPTILPLLLLVCLESTIVVVLNKVFKLPVFIDDRLVTMLGSAIAMLLAFRTNRSFDRYNQGAQLWTNLAIQIRHQARILWNGITVTNEDEEHEKNQMMKLLLATAVATKHALRGYDPYRFRELKRLLPEGYAWSSYRSSLIVVDAGSLVDEKEKEKEREKVGGTEHVRFQVDVGSTSSGGSAGGGVQRNRAGGGWGISRSQSAEPELDGSRGRGKSSSSGLVKRRRSSRIRGQGQGTQATRDDSGKNSITSTATTSSSSSSLLNILSPSSPRLSASPSSTTPTPTTTTSSVSAVSATTTPTFPHPFSQRRQQDLHIHTPHQSIPRSGNVINAPLDILHRISAYVRRQRLSKRLEVEDGTALFQSISSAIDSVTKFEQILYIPVPRSYDIHMKQILILYFVSLPFQLVKTLGWATIFATLVMSLAFFGTDAIAGEVSEPFGKDQNDLPLDYFCKKLREDLEYIMEQPFELDDHVDLLSDIDDGGSLLLSDGSISSSIGGQSVSGTRSDTATSSVWRWIPLVRLLFGERSKDKDRNKRD